MAEVHRIAGRAHSASWLKRRGASADARCTMALPAPKPMIDTCTSCGKLFPRVGIRLCGTCVPVEANRFEVVRQFLLEHDGASVGQIALATGVRASEVRAFLETGRLVAREALAAACSCGGVGERCRACRARLADSFRGLEDSMRRDHQERDLPAGDPGSENAGRTVYVRRMRRIGGQP